jgi:hypothetical protein
MINEKAYADILFGILVDFIRIQVKSVDDWNARAAKSQTKVRVKYGAHQ